MSQDTTNKKQLLGFECFKLKAVEHQLDSQTGEIENYIYEMWVTDKIALPAYVPIPFCSAVTDWCALECTLTTEKMPNTYTLYRAILLSENLPAGKLQIPDWAK